MLSIAEIKGWLDWVKPQLKAARLQNAYWFEPNQFILEFYYFQQFYLIFLGSPTRGQLLLIGQQHLVKQNKKPKPLTLFINAHLKNQKVSDVVMPQTNERIVQCIFKSGEITFYLIPGRVNVSVNFNTQLLWLFKPKMIEAQPLTSLDNSCVQPWSETIELDRYRALITPQTQAQSGTPEQQSVRHTVTSVLDFQQKKQKLIEQLEQAVTNKQQQIAEITAAIDQLNLQQSTFDHNRLPKWFQLKQLPSMSWYNLLQQLYAKRKILQDKLIRAQFRWNELRQQSFESMQVRTARVWWRLGRYSRYMCVPKMLSRYSSSVVSNSPLSSLSCTT